MITYDHVVSLTISDRFLWRFNPFGALGLRAYDPWTESKCSKMSRGYTDMGFEFLGCDIKDGKMVPTIKKRQALLDRVDTVLVDSQRLLGDPALAYRRKKSMIPTLSALGNMLEGWDKSYAFCDRKEIFENLNTQVHARISHYVRWCKSRAMRDPELSGLVRGVYMLGL